MVLVREEIIQFIQSGFDPTKALPSMVYKGFQIDDQELNTKSSCKPAGT